MTQLFQCSSFGALVTLAAALDAGLFPVSDHRVLLLTNVAEVPEVVPPLGTLAGFDELRARFDAVLDWNDVIAPAHPGVWRARPEDVPMLSRLFARAMDLPSAVSELVVETVHAGPGRALAEVVPDCLVTVIGTGLSVYGPTPAIVAASLAHRVTRLVHANLVPSLPALLLAEHGVSPTPIPRAALALVLHSLPTVATAAAVLLDPGGDDLRGAALDGLLARGHRDVLLLPAPTATRRQQAALIALAADRGLTIRTLPPDVPAEVVLAGVAADHLDAAHPDAVRLDAAHPDAAHLDAAGTAAHERDAAGTDAAGTDAAGTDARASRAPLIVGGDPDLLLLARTLLGLDVARVDTTPPAAQTPFARPDRIALTIVDAVVAPLDGSAVPDVDLAGLIAAVAFCRQPRILADLRPTVARWITTHPTSRWIPQRRLDALELSGPVRAVLVRAARRLRRTRPTA